ncbi:DNA repair protein [Yersinia enterocolitica]|uniref:KAP family NTPase n=1 Tax=Yersinia enterocolitica TaxID=630 RepID=UPI0021E88548|nr:KAP family NTPase [Yersinia enterocolitica]EKN3404560.1 DNA repair protein [Yersinia enterocolitica]EKN3994497.1 DNA repair protein [Yersinia enterocolitica]EKN4156666.1 DNA repair protein [Yersinia enterocolitica]EKN5085139.1 DNA repair protein [Yersinia enterocolitica]EKN5115669.1 DNA repair protein [Yersinia enterocolitica]
MNTHIFRNNDEIGKLEAESDSYLDSCFYETNIFKGIMNFDPSEKNPDFTRRIIVGRTGSGKSALLRKILDEGSIKVYDKIEAENTIFEHVKNNIFISSLNESGIDLRVFYKSLWLHALLIKVIPALHRSSYQSFFNKIQDLIGGKKKPYNPELANEYINQFKDVFFNDKALVEISNKMQHELSAKIGMKGINLGGKLGSEDTQKIQSETSSYVSRELIRKQKELIKILNEEFSETGQFRIIISIDDLDRSWLSSSDIRYDFINALLEAFRELLDIKSVKILISIRTDILMGIYNKTLRQDEKDQSLIYSISWNKTEIREIIDRRINHLVKNKYQGSKSIGMRDIFNFSIDGISSDDYILDRTMLRPRDAISFVNYCLKECDGNIVINKDIVLMAEEKFFSSRKRALVSEWVSIYKNISDYVDSLSILQTAEFSMESITEYKKNEVLTYLFDRIISTDDDPLHSKIVMNFDELIKVWFVVGVIGIKRTSSLIIYSSYDKPDLDITDMSRTFAVHPLFNR